jgi:hypothetical protein
MHQLPHWRSVLVPLLSPSHDVESFGKISSFLLAEEVYSHILANGVLALEVPSRNFRN